MTPLEHYREAERWMAFAENVAQVTDGLAANAIAAAQVHATLANAHMTAGVWGTKLPDQERVCRVHGTPMSGGDVCETCFQDPVQP